MPTVQGKNGPHQESSQSQRQREDEEQNKEERSALQFDLNSTDGVKNYNT